VVVTVGESVGVAVPRGGVVSVAVGVANGGQISTTLASSKSMAFGLLEIGCLSSRKRVRLEAEVVTRLSSINPRSVYRPNGDA
jgi:hypothetical protein